MTPTSLGVVLMGDDGGTAPGSNDAFEVRVGDEDVHDGTQRATAVVEALAASCGYRLKSVGVTWSDDVDVEATMLMASLTESGFDNVVPIRLPEATEALARGIAEVIGYHTTAVCVIEPDMVVVLIVDTRAGAVQTAVNHNIDGDESLIGWLSTVFARADWQPGALVVVGSAGDFAEVLPALEEALSVPVFAPAEAQLALARGAALASNRSVDLPFDETVQRHSAPAGGQRRHGARGFAAGAPNALMALLIAGVLTFVVSGSMAIALQLSPTPARPETPARVSEAAVRVDPPPPALPPPVAIPAPAPIEMVPAPHAPDTHSEAVPVVDAPVEATHVVPVQVTAEPAAPPPQVPDPQPVAGMPAQVAPVNPALVVPPQTKKPILDRIRERLRLGGG